MSSAPSTRKKARLWRLLLAAAALAAAVDLAIYWLVAPEFEASALVRLDSYPRRLFPDANETIADREAEARRFIAAQVAMIPTDRILDVVLAHPINGPYLAIKNSASPADAIRARLKVAQIPATDLIVISFKSTIPAEAADVVNTVVLAYIMWATDEKPDYERMLRSDMERCLSELRERKLRKLHERLSMGDAEMNTLFNRQVYERLIPILIERGETDDAVKKAELENKGERLRAMLRGEGDAEKFLDWKADYEAIRRDEDDVSRKLLNLQFASAGRRSVATQVRIASVPKAPADDPRWLYMVVATAAVLLAGLAVGLRLDPDRAADDPPQAAA